MTTREAIPGYLVDAFAKAIVLANEAADGGNYPIGAVVCDSEGVIASASSTLVHDCDPSAHPEMVAVRRACETRQCRYLPGAFLVSTLEPCPMCTSVAIWARMEGIAFSTSQDDVRAIAPRLAGTKFTFRQIGLRCADVARVGDPPLAVLEGYERQRVLEIYERFASALGR